jgi:hypothetical protein
MYRAVLIASIIAMRLLSPPSELLGDQSHKKDGRTEKQNEGGVNQNIS